MLISVPLTYISINPFLIQQDRLRLSECSTWLLRYRNCLSHIKLTHHNGSCATTHLENGLIRLLSQQTCVSSLSICHQSALRWVLESGGCRTIKVLDVSCVHIKVSLADFLYRDKPITIIWHIRMYRWIHRWASLYDRDLMPLHG